METHKLWTLSTAHLTPTELMMLETQNDIAGFEIVEFSVYSRTDGYIVSVGDISDLSDVLPAFPNLSLILIKAAKEGIAYILFDRDGPIEEALETFNHL